jgi:ribonuclease HI
VVESIVVYTDGAARGNPGPSASGYMAIQGSKVVSSEFEYNGSKTNNYAEYHAVEMALSWCLENLSLPPSAKIAIFSDSELIVKQLNGEYKTKAPKLGDLKRRVQELAAKFGSVSYGNLPRSDRRISRVDAQLNKLLDDTQRKD